MSPGQPEGSGSRLPIVRHFIACERVNRSLDGKHYSLLNVIHTIQSPSEAASPFIYPEMWLFVQVTDGRGMHSFQLQLFLLAEEEKSIQTWRSIQHDLGQDPLEQHVLPFKVRNVPFQRPGMYEFRLLCDGVEIAREPILMKGKP